MPSTVSHKLVHDILKLPRDARAFLAAKLLESLDDEEDFQVPKHVIQEVDEICKRIDQGEFEMLPQDEVFRQIEAKLE